jgi:1,4-alpha-glucan branching enzyme
MGAVAIEPERAQPPANSAGEDQAAAQIRSGAIDQGGGRVTFGLWAPWKKGVQLVGDFNDWDAQALPMQPLESGMWVAELQLEPGEYGYQFVVDAQSEKPIWISDPYARKLRWEEGNPQPHALVSVGKEPYIWGDEGFSAKPLNELIIYELHVGDFSPSGDFKGVTEKLDYLHDLGVRAIELMPVQEFPGDVSWGYNPAYFFAPESAYGSADDLKELVDQAHRRGIGIILDMVFNHTDASNPLTRLYAYQDNPYFGEDGNPWGFPDFNHWDDATKRLIHDVQDYWLLEFHIDGFRYDHAEGIGFDATSGMQFLGWAARQTKPQVWLIAEQIQDPVSVVQKTEIDASWHESFHRYFRAQLREGDFEGHRYGDMEGVLDQMIYSRSGYSDNANAINYIETHDQERIAYEVRTNPSLDNDEAVRAKCKLGALALYTASGVPMIYAGQEFATHTPKSIDVNKLEWERLNDPVWEDLKNFFAGMAALRASQPALTRNNLEALVVDNERKMIVFKRWNEEGNQVVVGLNFAPVTQHIEVTFPRAGRWHEWVYDSGTDFGDAAQQSVELPASGGKVWIAA